MLETNTLELAIFSILALFMLGGSLTMISAKQTYISAFGFLVAMLGLAGEFALLDSRFLAVAQIMVSVGAIVILSILTILTINAKEENLPNEPYKFLWIIGTSILVAPFTFILYNVLKSLPKISHEIIMKSPTILRENQSEFSKTGGIHASGLFSDKGDVVAIREDVGRHNALDKLIGYVLEKKLLNPSNQFLTCSGRLNFELVQKALMSNIGVLIGVGAPTSLAIDLANKFDMTLVGFVKQNSFNIYSNKERIIIKS